MTTKKRKPRPRARCIFCGTTGSKKNPVRFGPDPYAAEIDNDDTPHYICDECDEDRRGDL